MNKFSDQEITTYPDLLEVLKANSINYDYEQIKSAYDFITDIYDDTKRLSGQTVVEHSVAVAGYIAMLGLDTVSVVAALLHGAIELDKVTIEELDKKFGTDVAFIVDGLSNLKNKSKAFGPGTNDAQSFRKLMIAASEDIRVLIIRLTDKYHNLKSIEYIPEEKQITQAKKYKAVYAPLCEYLGLGHFQATFENKSFEILHPEEYKIVKEVTDDIAKQSHLLFSDLENDLKQMIAKYNIKVHSFSYRKKNYSSTYNKVLRKYVKPGEDLSEANVKLINDLLGIRIIVETLEECYVVLGLVNSKWKTLEDEFDDYITNPKPSGYRSIHAVINHNGNFIEIQIRTKQMHEYNEFGPASHIAYKLQSESKNKHESTTWTKDLIEWQTKADLTKEDFKVKAFTESIFVFTPKGQVQILDKESTPIDFAFKVHGEIGAKYMGAKVDGKMVSMNHKLDTGNTVEVITTAKYNVSRDWLRLAKMTETKSNIRKYLRKLGQDI